MQPSLCCLTISLLGPIFCMDSSLSSDTSPPLLFRRFLGRIALNCCTGLQVLDSFSPLPSLVDGTLFCSPNANLSVGLETYNEPASCCVIQLLFAIYCESISVCHQGFDLCPKINCIVWEIFRIINWPLPFQGSWQDCALNSNVASSLLCLSFFYF